MSPADQPVPLDAASRRDPARWPRLKDEDWVALHVPRFGKLRPRFEECARVLSAVLSEARKTLAPEAIIQVRAKEVPSFAEKILRKKALYVDPKFELPPDPLMRLTDLCGGRVICQTEQQVQAFTDYIGRHFVVDWKNSDDAGERLHPREFGYRTINRVVSFKEGAFPADLVPDSLCGPMAVPGLGQTWMPLKMEIQIRTILAHAWADVSHDLAYKTEVRLPPRIVRRLASKAAILEETDRDIGHLIVALEEFRSNFGAHHKRKEVEAEIALQRIVLGQISHSDKRAALAVKIAKLCLAIGEPGEAVGVLSPLADRTQDHAVQRALGEALVELYREAPQGAAFRRGRRHLRNAGEAEGADAETFCLAGEAAWLSHDWSAATAAYHRAITCDAAEPGSLARYLEHEVATHRDAGLVRLAEPMIRNAMRRGRTQIEGCVNLPGAWAALSLLHLLVGEPHAALDALAHLVALCDAHPGPPANAAKKKKSPGKSCAAARHLRRLLQAVERLAPIQESLAGYAAVERALLLALAIRGQDPGARERAAGLASWNVRGKIRHLDRNQSVLIVSGGCSADVEPLVSELKPHLLQAFRGLPPTGRSWMLVSGGTKAGVSRLVGDVAEASGGRIKACGYLPKSVPTAYEIERDSGRYAWLRESPGKDFTALDPLQGWTDLATAGVDLKGIKLLAFAPGEISRFEMAFALALGVRVGLIDHPAVPPGRHFDETAWLDHLEEGSFVRLPLDAMTLRAFLLTDEIPEADQRYEAAARMVHEDYLKSAKPADPSLSPWEKLPEPLKLSNFHQVAYWRNILATEGLGVREGAQASDGQEIPEFDIESAIGDAGVRRLAEMEHGRWNVERLLRGWRWAEEKDVLKKLSPYLVPWTALAPEIQGYDISAIKTLPKNLRAAGFEVFQER